MVAFCAVVVKSKVVAKRESGISPGPVAEGSSLAARPSPFRSRRVPGRQKVRVRSHRRKTAKGRKKDLVALAQELGQKVDGEIHVIDLRKLIMKTPIFTADVEFSNPH
ncbi:hypothetical protein CDAR_14711 [Caerostris darwini]|uniref:Uncharacterized protein n=1 Tax=Caerostris darwini TaxID=1538125 RepID=A0AAV4QZH3_9ARAC|nr:hypothetical protein CDAR_14711 [Caerostris darwini]